MFAKMHESREVGTTCPQTLEGTKGLGRAAAAPALAQVRWVGSAADALPGGRGE